MTVEFLECIVIDIQRSRFADEVAPALSAIQAQGAIRVTDLVFIEKDARGELVIREVDDLADNMASVYDGVHDSLAGLLTAEDIARSRSALATARQLAGRAAHAHASAR